MQLTMVSNARINRGDTDPRRNPSETCHTVSLLTTAWHGCRDANVDITVPSSLLPFSKGTALAFASETENVSQLPAAITAHRVSLRSLFAKAHLKRSTSKLRVSFNMRLRALLTAASAYPTSWNTTSQPRHRNAFTISQIDRHRLHIVKISETLTMVMRAALWPLKDHRIRGW